MSCKRKVKTFEVEKIVIDTCSKKEIEQMEKAIIFALEQKIEKIKILIKNCDVYSYNGCILVNDRYNVCIDLINVCEAFGLSINQIQTSLRGKNYLITDSLYVTLKQLGVPYIFGKNVSNKESSDEIVKIIESNSKDMNVDEKILEFVKNIKQNGVYTSFREREVTKIIYDETVLERKEGEWSVDVKDIQDKLLNLAKGVEAKINGINQQLRDGTSKLIYTRAKQMGYSVQEIKKGNQTQLVLVRYE